ncbi:MAG: SDR family oxidoreductase [Geodermatophilaceae bacterium]|nr:SDR family oxidoreductase [Geodermatophilaceae bacterium]
MRTVLVTGVTSGIGAETALALDRAGWSVVGGARDLDDAAALVKGTSDRFRPVRLDVTDAASIAAAVATIGELDAVVNNAGVGIAGPLEVLPLDHLREQLEVNVIGQIAVTQAVLPLIRRSGGRIVFVGSIGGKIALEFAGPYHASKYAMEAVADVLRQELAEDGIPVVLIEPGAMATPIWAKAATRLDALFEAAPPGLDRYASRLRSFQDSLRSAGKAGASPAKVAETILTALDSDSPAHRYAVGASAKAVSALRPILPDKLVDFIGSRLSR